MNGTLDGKSALVTGGAGGFGKACALALARDGAAVTLMGRNAASLAQARAWLLAQAPDARIAVHAGDATADADVQAALASAVAHGGGLDIVVATVGGGGYRTVLEQDLATFMADMQLNVGSAFAAVRHGAPLMRDGGAFVFISSTAAVLSFQGLSSYCAGKAALDHFVRVAADELGSRGIRLNCVRPGLTHTDGMDPFFANPAYVESFKPLIPLGRTGMPVDIAAAVRFLAGPESSWITGQSFAADGGNELRGAPRG
ncbi:MAG: SDR family oxidoreductase [Gammaproteobacteria bacterium]|nr:SDR family oxidoreductase [Gammaproteobacteria bacterium]